MYLNYRCRECRKIISMDDRNFDPKHTRKISRTLHRHCKDTIDPMIHPALIFGLFTVCDLISTTDNPHKDAVDVYKHEEPAPMKSYKPVGPNYVPTGFEYKPEGV